MRDNKRIVGKRIMGLVLVLALVITSFPSYAAVAAEPLAAGDRLTFGDYQYILDTDGTAEIAKYNGTEAEVEIPEQIDGHTVDVIGESCFEYSKIKKAVIPYTVKEIEDYAFNHCTGLEKVEFDGTSEPQLSVIGKSAFFTCNRLTGISIPESVKKIGDGAFYECQGLTSLVIDAELQEAGDYAFANCTALEYCVLNKMDKIGDLMFQGCNSLVRIDIPDGTREIGRKAFAGCGMLESVSIPDSVEQIGDLAFDSTKLSKIYFNCKRLGKQAFRSCSELIDVDFGEELTDIGEETFTGTRIGNVLLPASVKNISESAFEGCECRRYVVDEANTAFSSRDGVLFDKAQTKLIAYPIKNRRTSYTIPDSVEELGGRSFSCCENLEQVQFGSSVQTIGDYCFSRAQKRTSPRRP